MIQQRKKGEAAGEGANESSDVSVPKKTEAVKPTIRKKPAPRSISIDETKRQQFIRVIYVLLVICFIALFAVLGYIYQNWNVKPSATKLKMAMGQNSKPNQPEQNIRDQNQNQQLRMFTQEELTKYNGKNSKKIYLAILGEVFDVTSKKQTYGPGGGYHFFAGTDATRAYSTGDFKEEGLTDDITGLTPKQMLDIQQWLEFYYDSPEYPRVGYVAGRYYDSNGQPTEELKKAKSLIKQGQIEQDEAESEKHMLPPCNSRWTNEAGGEVWCSTLSGGISRDWEGVPRLYHKPGSKEAPRCACIKSAETAAKDPTLKLYPGCDPNSVRCKMN